jgi:hypothetical protein
MLIIVGTCGFSFAENGNTFGDENPSSSVVVVHDKLVSDMVDLVMLLIYTWDIMVSCLVSKVSYPDVFLWFLLVPPGKYFSVVPQIRP